MKNKLILKEFFTDVKKIIRLISSISKSFIPIMLLKNIFLATLPFINIYFSYLILDALILEQPRDQIFNYIIYMVSLNLVIGILYAYFTKLTAVISNRINLTMKAKISDKALLMDYEQLENKNNLEMLHKARDGSTSHGGITAFCDLLGSTVNHLLSLIYAVILLGSLFKVATVSESSLLIRIFNSPFAPIALMIIFFLSIILNFVILNRINKKQYQFFEQNVDGNRLFFYFINLTTNYHRGKDFRTYNMGDMIEDEMSQINNRICGYMFKLGNFIGKQMGLNSLVNHLVIFITYAFVGIKAILKLISIGSILKFVSSLTILNNSLTNLVYNFTNLDILRKYLKNYVTFIELQNNNYQGTIPIEKRNDNEYEFEFKDVSFHYPNNNEMILNNVSIKLKIGTKMAIVGPNGAGKTTFIKLLCRLYEPTAGEILLNGINIKLYDYKEYLDLISVVFQDFRLFAFDIAQNVAANTIYDEDTIWEVLDQAGIKNRIDNMENKIHSNIYQSEENGIEISGGEAQKIAIARALYKNTPLVILDEPTSALDPISEYEIYSKFDKLVNDKTSIYISHRMSSCRFCDNIVVFDKGKIIQSGNHLSLMKEKGGLYQKLWNAQAKYYNI